MTSLRPGKVSANAPLLLMALAILADGITTVIAVNIVGLHEANPLANLLGGFGPANDGLDFDRCNMVNINE